MPATEISFARNYFYSITIPGEETNVLVERHCNAGAFASLPNAARQTRDPIHRVPARRHIPQAGFLLVPGELEFVQLNNMQFVYRRYLRKPE
jgi:hypothetical protein